MAHCWPGTNGRGLDNHFVPDDSLHLEHSTAARRPTAPTTPTALLQAHQDAVNLADVPYAASNGSFAVNLWMRRPTGADTSGTTYQYLFSQAKYYNDSPAEPSSVSGAAGVPTATPCRS